MFEAVWIQRYMQNNHCCRELLSLAREADTYIMIDLHLIQWHRWANVMGRSHIGGNIWLGS